MAEPNDPLTAFLKRQQASPAPRSTPPISQRLVITRLHLPFGDVFQFALQMTAASLVISVGLWAIVLLLMIFGVGLGWLAR